MPGGVGKTRTVQSPGINLSVQGAPRFNGFEKYLRIGSSGRQRYFESRNGATTSRVSLLGTTGTISNVMPKPWQFKIHS
jgi:hypothetical protein